MYSRTYFSNVCQNIFFKYMSEYIFQMYVRTYFSNVCQNIFFKCMKEHVLNPHHNISPSSFWWDLFCFCVVLFCFVLFVLVLCLVFPMLPVSLDCSFLIATLVFSNVYLNLCKNIIFKSMLNPTHYDVYSIQLYLIKFVSELLQIDGFLRVLWFPPPMKLTSMI